MTPSSDFLREATERGFVFQCTDTEALDEALSAAPLCGYIGYDCTADSLHVGHLVQIMLLRLMQRHGHRPVALMGGGTSRIGDPSFRDEARQLLSDEQIAANMEGIRRCFAPFLRFADTPPGAIMPNNADWLDRLGYIELLRDVGVHFSVNRMLSFDSVKSRLEREHGLTFLEFNYCILQSYDFRELFRRHRVVLQMGGSDQWGNIVSGVDLIRRTDRAQVFGLTTPLITTASGNKMGKTASGAVWLVPDKTSVFDYWQYWRNADDADVGRFLRLFTELALPEIARLEELGGAEINQAKKILATEATALLHGRSAADQAQQAAEEIFADKGEVALPALTAVGMVTVPIAEFEQGAPAFRVFVRAGLATSNAAARKLIRGGGARINDAAVTDEGQLVSLEELRSGVKLSAGRKHHRFLQAE